MREKESIILGMDYGTATNRLKKLVLYDLAKKTGNTVCFRCGLEISSPEELSLDHKEHWLESDNPTEYFWDLDNIAFSHKSCNSSARISTGKKVGPDGTSWCSRCAKFLPLSNFSKSVDRWNGLQYICKSCVSLQRPKKKNTPHHKSISTKEENLKLKEEKKKSRLERDSAISRMYSVESLTREEIASTLGVSRGIVMSSLKRQNIRRKDNKKIISELGEKTCTICGKVDLKREFPPQRCQCWDCYHKKQAKYTKQWKLNHKSITS